ncbi:MAG TPA: hypothetical protein VJS15_04820, partial [Allosphingosinicella sp.]|nr:hypothetical protein [Allosphingosinicella sp.]
MPANPLVQRRVNDSVAGDQLGGQILVSSSGDVLATWFSPGRRARVLDDDGDPVSAEIALPTATSTAAWIAPDEFAILSDNGGIAIQRYDRAGAAVGGAIAVAAGGTADDLALLASGSVVATYRVGNEIRGRILDSTLTPAGAEFLIYNVGTRRVDETIVTPLTGGGFAFTVDFGSLGLGTPLERVALFDGSGNKTASIAPGLIEKPDVDALPDGGFMIASGSLNGDIRFYNADGTLRAQSTTNVVGANLDITLLGTEIVLLTYERTVSG